MQLMTVSVDADDAAKPLGALVPSMPKSPSPFAAVPATLVGRPESAFDNQGSDPPYADDGSSDPAEDYDSDMLQHLLNASVSGDAAYVKQLLDEGLVDVESLDPLTRRSALHLACLHDQPGVIRSLLEAGADALTPDPDRVTPLHLAAAHSGRCLALLLQRLRQQAEEEGGGDRLFALWLSSAIDMQLRSPAHWAAKAGAAMTVPVVYDDDEGSEVTAPPPHLPPLQQLLQAGVDAAVCDSGGRTPLSLAAGGGHSVAVGVLLSHASSTGSLAAALSTPDASGSLPLHRAAEGGHAEVLPLLLLLDQSGGAAAGIDGVGIETEEPFRGRTALHLCAARGHVAAARACLQLGSHPSPVDSGGATPCHLAAENGHVDVLLLLFEAGVRPVLPDKEGWLPIHLATNQGHAACVDALLAGEGSRMVGAPNEAPGIRCGWTPLHCAAKQGDVAMVRHLMALGADPTARDAEGLSPQHHAAADGQHDVLAALLGLPPPSSEEMGLSFPSEEGGALEGFPPPLEGGCVQGGSGVTVGPEAGDAVSREWEAAPAPSAAHVSHPAVGLIGSASVVDYDPVPADSRGMPAVGLVGPTPLSLSIIRRRDACTDLLIGLAGDQRGPHELPLFPALPPVAATKCSLFAPPSHPPPGSRDPTSMVREDAAASPLLPQPQPQQPTVGMLEVPSSSLPLPPLPTEVLLPTWPSEPVVVHAAAAAPVTTAAEMSTARISTAGACEVAIAGVAARWVPSGLVSGLVDVEDNVLRSYQGNNDIEAWLWHVDGAPQLAGWQYFEVEVLELGASGLFWLGWSPGPQQATAVPSSFGSTPRQSPSASSGEATTAAASAFEMSPVSSHPHGWHQHGLALHDYHPASMGPLGSMRVSGSFASGGGSGSGGGGHIPSFSSRGGSLLSSSYAICSLDGRKMQPGGRDSAPYLPKLMKGDVVGLLFNRACCTISVTHNRKFISVAFSGVSDGRGGDGGGGRDGGSIEPAWSDLSRWGSAAGAGNPLPAASRMASLHGLEEHSCSSSLPSAGSPSRQGWGAAAAAGEAGTAAAGATMRPMCPVIGLKSGGAVLRFLTHGSEFFKNIDALLFREEQLHNPQHLDPASSTPWRFKRHMHALHFAAASNNLHALSALLARWPDHVNARDGDGWTPLTMACIHGHVEAVRRLTAAGADVDAPTYYGTTPLTFAVRHCHEEMVEVLVAAGADLRAVDHNRRTLLMRAAKSGSIPILKLLLEKGADIHAKDKHGKTLLQFPKDDKVFRFLYDIDRAELLKPSAMYQRPQGQYPRPSWEIAPEDIAIDRDALKLGSGAFGTVYRAKWRGGLVAAKVMRGMLGPLVRQAFEEEIVLMEQMRHPNVIQFLGAVIAPDDLVIVTELASLGDLQGMLRQRREGGLHAALTDGQLLEMARDIARGMVYLHGHRTPIVHRDLKPQNCLVTYSSYPDKKYCVKIGDFGLSAVKGQEMFSSGLVTTVVYTAPEMACGTYNEKVDVYSYGAILYEMVTGNMPWSTLNNLIINQYVLQYRIFYNPDKEARLKLRDELPSGGLDPRVQSLIAACLDPEPALRPSFTEVLKQLEGLPRDIVFSLGGDAAAEAAAEAAALKLAR